MNSPLSSVPIVQGMKEFTEPNSAIRHCKIIGTLGPASSSPEVIEQLVVAGMNIARLNFSHGDHETHLKNIETIRKVAEKVGRNVTILQDLQGPKIRCGHLLNGQIQIEKTKVYQLYYGHEQQVITDIPIDYENLSKDVRVSEEVMMDDGLLRFKVLEVDGSIVRVEAQVSGVLKNRKGVNFPHSKLSLPALTEKDSKDLLFGVTHGVDVVALSFVQTHHDVVHCRRILTALGSDLPIIAKIEKISAIENIEAIAKEANGLMVARGDLGVEAQVEKVPIMQRQIIGAASRNAIPVIIATQMLESMVDLPEASASEVTDVANAVLEGADCVMLSAEVAAGKYPVKCIEKMVSIIREVESWNFKKSKRYSKISNHVEPWQTHTAIARAVAEAADGLQAKAIVCLTLTGSIARFIASWRPSTPIIAISPRNDVIQRLGYTWGVFGMRNPLFYNTDVLLQDLPQLLKSLSIVQSGDIIVITAGIPLSQICPTNMIKINKIP